MGTRTWYADDQALDSDPLSTAEWNQLSPATDLSTSVIAEGDTPLGGTTGKAWEIATTNTTNPKFWVVNEQAAPATDETSESLILGYIDMDPAGSIAAQFGGAVRLSGTRNSNGGNYGYGVGSRIDTPADLRDLRKDDTSNITFCGGQNVAHGQGEIRREWFYYRTRVETSGTDHILRGKVWKHGTTEPGTFQWNQTCARSGTPHDSGNPGFMLGTGSVTGYAVKIAYWSAGWGADAAPMPTPAATLGITITGIKEPNIADEAVTDVSNARVKVWYGASPVDTGAEDEIITGQTITNGSLTTELEGGTLDDNAIVEILWTVGTERKLVIAETTVIDIGSGS